MNWPDDADGDVLRGMAEDGFDFDRECEIDFNIDFESWPPSIAALETITKLYPGSIIIDPDEEDIKNGHEIGYVQFQVFAKLTYDLVMDTQKTVTDQMRPFGGWCESWGFMQD